MQLAPSLCKAPGCEFPAWEDGLCARCLGDPGEPVCVNGDGRPRYYALDVCRLCYMREWRKTTPTREKLLRREREAKRRARKATRIEG